MKNIVNIINFVRDVEPRRPKDLYTPVVKQLEIIRENGLRGTFLLQYDVLCDEKFIELFKNNSDICELGVWCEVVQPLVEKVGAVWNGRYPWDWFCNAGFLISYVPTVRKKLVDEIMRKFKGVFGYYPESIGAWHFDAQSMARFSDKYDVKACCICRDQVGTDGYTMQGGYYNQAYFPSRNNMFCPASTDEMQINMPVFRMLGSDPIYAYNYKAVDYGLPDECPTLEPVWHSFGGSEKWCKWFFDEVFDGTGHSFQYTQAGQENSFGWDHMDNGIEFQFPYIKKLQDEGKIEVMTLAQAGKWYSENFKSTPPASISALSDWKGSGHKAIWYNSKYYRAGLFWDNGIVCLRDLYVFNEDLEEKYLRKPCRTESCEFRNLPIIDSALYTSVGSARGAGAYFKCDCKDIIWSDISYAENDGCSYVTLTSENLALRIRFSEDTVLISGSSDDWYIESEYDKDLVYSDSASQAFDNKENSNFSATRITDALADEKHMRFRFEGIEYGISAVQGKITDYFDLFPENGAAEIKIDGKC